MKRIRSAGCTAIPAVSSGGAQKPLSGPIDTPRLKIILEPWQRSALATCAFIGAEPNLHHSIAPQKIKAQISGN